MRRHHPILISFVCGTVAIAAVSKAQGFAARSSVLGIPDTAARTAIHKTQEIGRKAGEQVWRGMGTIPFDILLIEKNRETLFCSPIRSDFGTRKWDPITRCWMQTRARTKDPDLFGALDLFENGRSIIALPPLSKDWEPALWTALVVHEHFHQLQDSQPWMEPESIALSKVFGGGSGTNNWQLAYPFPYQRDDVNAVFDKMAKAALDFLQAKTSAERSKATSDYLEHRASLERLVSPNDWRYFEEQMWVEGIARWTQAPVMDAYARMTHNSRWIKAAEDMHKARITSLISLRRDGIKKWKRGAIYEVGPVEAEIAAERCKDWKDAYWAHHFTMKPLLTGDC